MKKKPLHICLYVVYLLFSNYSVEKKHIHMKKIVNQNVNKLNGNVLNVLMQIIKKTIVSFSSSPLIW